MLLMIDDNEWLWRVRVKFVCNRRLVCECIDWIRYGSPVYTWVHVLAQYMWVRIWSSWGISASSWRILLKWTSWRCRFLNRSISKTIGSYEFIFRKQTTLCTNIHENNVLDDDSDDFDRFRRDLWWFARCLHQHHIIIKNHIIIIQNHIIIKNHHQKSIFHFCPRNVSGTPGWWVLTISGRFRWDF